MEFIDHAVRQINDLISGGLQNQMDVLLPEALQQGVLPVAQRGQLVFAVQAKMQPPVGQGVDGAAQPIGRMGQFLLAQAVLGIPQLPVKRHHPLQIVYRRRPHPLTAGAVPGLRHTAVFFAAGVIEGQYIPLKHGL